MIEAGRAEEVRAHSVDFVSSLFEIDGSLKRYVGGLVRSMDQTSAYRLPSLRAMMEVSASLFVRLLVSDETWSTSNR